MNANSARRARKLGILGLGLAFVGFIAYTGADETQSRFVYRAHGQSALFMDKYLPKERRRELEAGLGEATRGALRSVGIELEPGDEPRAFFAAFRHYAVLGAGDRLVAKRLRGVPSSDFSLFNTIGKSMFSNELVADTLSSRDGHYVFITAEGDWRRAALHGYLHAAAARNAPPRLRARMGSDAEFDAETWYAFRFVDEAAAMLLTDLPALAAERGGSAAALAAYPAWARDYYASPEAPMYERERLVRAMTFNDASKTAALFRSAVDFNAFIIGELGPDATLALASRFIRGEYLDLHELFDAFGGFGGAMTAWKGSPDAPRLGGEEGRRR